LRKSLDTSRLWHEYIFGKQTLKELSDRYLISVSSVRRRLQKQKTVRIISSQKSVVVLMDTTYWGRNFGVMVFKDAHNKKILWRKFIDYETVAHYKEGIDWLENNGFEIQGIVCDGLRGMFSLSRQYKVQMCQYHQLKIVQRYLTKQPELEASKELLYIAKLLTHSDKEHFIAMFEAWAAKCDKFLKERSVDKKTKKSYFVHKKLRSAYLSIKRNMLYLWTFYDYPQRNIPNTNNALEGQFADLKTKLRNHSGLSKKHRQLFIDEYFKHKNIAHFEH
jgi:hypothetical protein